MAVTALEVRSRRTYAEGRSFGSVGPYERIDGIIRFAVDPAHERNGTIIDLDKAPRDTSGKGSTFPLAPIPETRQPGDTRPSIAERYPSRGDYLQKVRAAAEAQVERGYLLAEDVDVVVENAAARYDLFARES